MLKNPTVGGAGQKPKPRPDFGAVDAVAQAAGSFVTEPGHETVEIPRPLLVGQFHPHGQVGAEQISQLDVGFFAE